jgi:hypothetical protein
MKFYLFITIFMSVLNGFSQNWNQKLTFTGKEAEDEYSWSVSCSGDYVVIGAYEEDIDGYKDAGACYIYKNTNETWEFQQKIEAEEKRSSARFGFAVDIDSNQIIIGAWGEDAAYIFENINQNWTQKQRITYNDTASPGKWFGFSASLAKNYAIIGAYYDYVDENGENELGWSGSAYIFKKEYGQWNQLKKIVASDRQGSQWYGRAVSMNKDYAVVGTLGKGVYIYKNLSDSWTEILKIDSIGIGESLNLNNNNLIAGIPERKIVYIFNADSGEWEIKSILKASDPANNVNFGSSVAIKDSLAIIGADGSYKAYLFSFLNDNWVEVGTYSADNGSGSSEFGHSVDISSSCIVIGDYKFETNRGKAYIYYDQNILNIIQHKQNLFNIFPNPASNFIKLEYKLSKGELNIYDISGQLVKKHRITESKKIPINNLKDGLYLIEINTGEGVSQRSKLVVKTK